jgi:hypothetical protein
MSQQTPDHRDLVERIVVLTEEMEAIEHIGRYKRLHGRRQLLISALLDHPSRDTGLALLLNHEETAIRQVGGFAKGLFEAKGTTAPDSAPYRRKLFPFEPLPRQCSRTDVETLVCEAFPGDRGNSLLALLRPSIRPWPRQASSGPVESRFGGMPAVPSGWLWPHESEEPLLFLAQIDCAQVYATAGASKLPESGMLSFFGDHDDVTGCSPSGGGKVYYFPDITRLKPAGRPLDDFEPLITCGLAFYSHFELPDPKSRAIATLELTRDERESYLRLHKSIAMFGAALDHRYQ